jgi:pimeloyl-ACP methyl ester carboxylesterase
VILFGESLGAAVVTRLAADLCAAGTPPGGMVLRSPFRSLAAVGRVHYPLLPVGLLLRDRYEVASRLGGVTVPTAVVYGTEDSIVPPAQSRDVAASAARPAGTVVVPGADHNDPALVAGPLVLDAVTAVADAADGAR